MSTFSFKEMLELRKAQNQKKKLAQQKSKPSTITESNSSKSDSAHLEDDKMPSLSGTSTLEKLRRLEAARNQFNVPLNPPKPALHPKASQGGIKTIAICLIIVDKLHNEEIWREWIEQGDRASKDKDNDSPFRAQLYIHAKYPNRITSAWVRERTLSKTYSPEWNSPEVIRAMLAVLEDALRDKTCQRFVFGTESCMPIYNLHTAGSLLMAYDKSWMNAFHRSKNPFEEATCFKAVDSSIIPQTSVWKSIPGWIMLCRRHAKLLFDLPHALGEDLVAAWGKGQYREGGSNVWAPEEVYFPTLLALLGYLRDGGEVEGENEDQVRRKSVTYAEFKRQGDANPIAYPALTNTLLKNFRIAGAVFARKFGSGACTLEHWKFMMDTVKPPTWALEISGEIETISVVPISMSSVISTSSSNNNGNSSVNTTVTTTKTDETLPVSKPEVVVKTNIEEKNLEIKKDEKEKEIEPPNKRIKA
jgi:hypothetical protein